MSIEQRSSNSSESCTASLPSVGSRRARSRIRQWAQQRVSRVGLGCSLCGHGSPGAARSRCCARAVLLRGGAVGCLLLQRDVVLSRAGAGRTRPPRRRMPADHHTRHWVPFLCPDRARSGASVVVLLALGIPLRLRSWLSLLVLLGRRCRVARALRFSFFCRRRCCLRALLVPCALRLLLARRGI